MSDTPKCSICGEPMPEGEEMFKHHGYSSDCPKPPLQRGDTSRTDALAAKHNAELESMLATTPSYKQLLELVNGHMKQLADMTLDIERELSAAQEANHQLKLAFDDRVRVIGLQLKDKEELQKRIGELEDEIKRLYRHSLLSGE